MSLAALEWLVESSSE